MSWEQLTEQSSMNGPISRGITCPSPLSHASLLPSRRQLRRLAPRVGWSSERLKRSQPMDIDHGSGWTRGSGTKRRRNRAEVAWARPCAPWPWEHTALKCTVGAPTLGHAQGEVSPTAGPAAAPHRREMHRAEMRGALLGRPASTPTAPLRLRCPVWVSSTSRTSDAADDA